MYQLTITGNLGKDAEIKKVGNTDIITFSVGVYDNKETQWISVSLFRPLEKLQQILGYFTKGRKVLIQGKPNFRHYIKDNQIHVGISMWADYYEFLSSSNNTEEQPKQHTESGAIGAAVDYANGNIQTNKPTEVAPTAEDSQLPF